MLYGRGNSEELQGASRLMIRLVLTLPGFDQQMAVTSGCASHRFSGIVTGQIIFDERQDHCRSVLGDRGFDAVEIFAVLTSLLVASFTLRYEASTVLTDGRPIILQWKS